MVFADRGDNRDFGVDNIRRVEPSTQTGLDHRDIGVAAKVNERHRGKHLEHANHAKVSSPFNRFDARPKLVDQVREIALSNVRAVDLDPFRKRVQMR